MRDREIDNGLLSRLLNQMIGPFREWRSLPDKERKELYEALFLLWRIRLSLWILPFRRVRRRVRHRLCRPRDRKPEYSSRQTGRHVKRASRYVYRVNDLARCYATQIMLSRRGQPSDLRFGLREDGDQPEPQVWVEINGTVIIGEAVPDNPSDSQQSEDRRE